jgi:hypothetical protein
MGTSPLISGNPDPDDLRRLEEVIYEFNLQATGISDGKLFASFLRADKAVIGGISGWTWAKPVLSAIYLSQRNCESRDTGPDWWKQSRLKQSTEDATKSYFERMTFKPRSFTSSLALQ